MGRFISQDPIGYAAGINLYAYCGDDPTDATDPSGLSKVTGPALVVAGGNTTTYDRYFVATPFSALWAEIPGQVKSSFLGLDYVADRPDGLGLVVFTSKAGTATVNGTSVSVSAGAYRVASFVFFVVWPVCLDKTPLGVVTKEVFGSAETRG